MTVEVPTPRWANSNHQRPAVCLTAGITKSTRPASPSPRRAELQTDRHVRVGGPYQTFSRDDGREHDRSDKADRYRYGYDGNMGGTRVP